MPAVPPIFRNGRYVRLSDVKHVAFVFAVRFHIDQVFDRDCVKHFFYSVADASPQQALGLRLFFDPLDRLDRPFKDTDHISGRNLMRRLGQFISTVRAPDTFDKPRIAERRNELFEVSLGKVIDFCNFTERNRPAAVLPSELDHDRQPVTAPG